MRRRLFIVLIACACAALSTTLLMRSVGAERDNALASVHAVSVLVASERIESGTTPDVARTSVERKEIPKSALAPGALTDLDSVASLRTSMLILPGQQIVPEMWAPTVLSPLRPPPGMLGIAVQLGDPQRVAGFVTPGSKVALFATITAPGETGPRTRLLLSPVTVLGVGGSTVTTHTTETDGQTSTEQAPAAVLTLALNARQAEQVVFAVTQGQIYLGLLGEKVAVPTSGGVSAATVFGGAS